MKSKYLKFIFCLCVLLTNCQKDNLNDMNDNQVSEIISTEVNHFNDFENLNSLTKDILERKIANSVSEKDSKYKELYNFKIDSSEVLKAEYHGDIYYTLKINRENSIGGVLENLVIINKKNHDPEAFLFKYIPNEEYYEKRVIYNDSVFSGITKHIPLDYESVFSETASVVCNTYTVWICGNNGGPAGPGCLNHTDGGAHVYSTQRTKCYAFDNYFNDNETLDAGPSSNGGGGGGGSSTSTSNTTSYEPEDLTTADVITEPFGLLEIDEYWPEDFVLFQDIQTVRFISDVSHYLKDFDLTQPAKFTLYAKQPVPGKDDAYELHFLTPVVGHTFISIEQGSVTRVLGFYPAETTVISPVTGQNSGEGSFVNDENEEFDVSVTVNISAAQLNVIIRETKLFVNSDYDLRTHNCTDYGLYMAKKAGLDFGDAYGSWPLGGGSNPGTLGQIMRNSTKGTKNVVGGNGPSNSN